MNFFRVSEKPLFPRLFSRGEKAFFLFFFLFFLISEAAALSMNADKTELLLGDKISFSGSCAGTVVSVSVTVDEKKVLEQAANCVNRLYSVEIQALLEQPSGNWRFSFSDSTDQNFSTIFVSPKRETMLLALDVLSPSMGELKLNDSVDLSVQVFLSNAPFDDANVFYWLPDGSVASLDSAGNGIFKGKLEIPLDLKGKDWSLFIVAVNSERQLRGQVKKNFSLLPAEIVVFVVEPGVNRVEAGTAQSFLVEAAYANGNPVEGAVASASLGEEVFEMQKISENKFVFQKNFSEADIGSKTISFAVQDSFGNLGVKEFSFFVETSFWVAVLKNLFFVPVALAIIIVVVLAWFFVSRASSRKGLSGKIVRLKKEMKDLQGQYFKERSISEDFYRKKLNELSLAISEAEKELNKTKPKNK